jgi:hypothetical protein
MKLEIIHLAVTSDKAACFLCTNAHIYTFNMKKKAKSAKFFLNLVSLFSYQKLSSISTKVPQSSVNVFRYFLYLYRRQSTLLEDN